MPIHLPPLSRRRFLASSLTAGAGWLFARRAFAAEKPVDNDCWALLSDPHIAADRAKISRKVNMADHLAAASKEVAALPKRPAGAILNGDCAFLDGQAGDYEAVTDLLKPIRESGVPLHLTLGNHDDRDQFWKALTAMRELKRPVADHHVAMLPAGKANWFILDSLEKVNAAPGAIGAAQLKWLGDALDANADKPALVMVHHPLNRGAATGGIKDSPALLDLLHSRQQVKCFIYGHTHKWAVEKDDTGLHLVNLPPVAYPFKEGDPSGWVRVDLRGDGARFELSALDKQHPAHGQVVELKWRA